ncbi:alpha/beta-hydrolase family protein [Achromobacter seleniivolatilans]|uniref:Alpha/beta-hydrolase family protein n=1 Tax=Achromobacter seleniivolatilans TaxID=3047478 RepID=A0ABY9LZS5_9BURK|nr:alpha/beta-hydrolase family protein [Achromobacter sp. R39]WMD20271.1 alpha/beta-hydrolase family protein [Achromobacter sp. R39]
MPPSLQRHLPAFLRPHLESLSGVGLILGTLFFAASLTPTLVPRTYLTQGVLAGTCFAAGYGLGVLWHWVWTYLELPEPKARAARVINAVITLLCLTVVILFLWRAAEWQNTIRALMQMAPVTSAHPFKVSATALITFLVLLALARLFQRVARFVSRQVRRVVPRRVANVVGAAIAILLFWSLANNVFFRAALHMLDASFREYDALLEPERPQPTAAFKTGGPDSLVKWTQLGRAGREYIASGPSAAEIKAQTGQDAKEPVRVYVGLRAADTPQDRAKIALAEMKRVGAFNRSVLVLVTPTGTGWIDPAAMDSIEYLHHGDVASVAMQYSYLSSPLSLLAQPEYGAEAARALFVEVYNYWTALPQSQRPKLYLHGLSLGAMNSAGSAELFEMIGDPIQGALWSGPPFESRVWRAITNARNPGSPAWLPELRDGAFVRFMNQNGSPVPADAPWGPMRIVYLQYASDAVTFFDYRDLYRRPAWMDPPYGPDVSPDLRWYPVVTMLQLALDMSVSTHTPIGYGHVYAPQHYVDAWVAVTDVRDWPADALTKLKQHLMERARAAMDDGEGKEAAYDNRGG